MTNRGTKIAEQLVQVGDRSVHSQVGWPTARIVMDGELVTMKMPMAVSIVPGGLRVVVPHESRASALRR